MNISTPIEKVDTKEKLFGSAKYVDDISYEGMLYAVTFRSKHPKAKIISRSYPKLPKGYFIVDHTDLKQKNFTPIIFEDWKIFADDEVNYYKEPILLVIGEDKKIIHDIMDQIIIEYEVEEPVTKYTDSVINYKFSKGTTEPKEDADQILTYSYQTPYQEQLYIEPQGMIGRLHDGQMVLEGSIQCPYYVKNAVVKCLGSSEDYVRVIQNTVGGAFGGKEEFPSMIACQLATAVEKVKQPIKLVYEREEDVYVTTKRHPSKIDFKVYLNNKRIVYLESNVALDGGAYIGLSGVVLSRALIASTGVYTIDNFSVNGDVFKTNTVPNGAYRGFGAPQMFFAVEMLMNHLAKDLGINNLEFRRTYLAKQHDPTSTNGLFRDPILMDEMLEKVLKESDYVNKRVNKKIDGKLHGIGMCMLLHGCGFTGSGEKDHINALVKLHKTEDDHVKILIAAVDMGQGVKSSMRKIVSNMLEIPIEHVIYDNPDTNFVPDSGPTVASRTTMIVGGLIARACKDLKEQWVSKKEIIVSKRYEQPSYIKWNQDTFEGDAYPAYSWGINIVEVLVDEITYEVTPINIYSIYEIGKAIDERIVHGQADGGILQGIGYGYLEVMNHKDGILQQKNMTEYIIPTSVDAPNMYTYLIDNPYPLGPYGAKGVGELTLVGGAPAIAHAIENAINKKVNKIPVTPEYIMELMNDE